jgi:hypothetical protein
LGAFDGRRCSYHVRGTWPPRGARPLVHLCTSSRILALVRWPARPVDAPHLAAGVRCLPATRALAARRFARRARHWHWPCARQPAGGHRRAPWCASTQASDVERFGSSWAVAYLPRALLHSIASYRGGHVHRTPLAWKPGRPSPCFRPISVGSSWYEHSHNNTPRRIIWGTYIWQGRRRVNSDYCSARFHQQYTKHLDQSPPS